MKATKIPTDYILSDKEMKCLKTYNERQRRQFLASKADSLGCHGTSRVCEVSGISRNTLYRGRRELDSNSNETFPKGRVRAAGGGRTPILKAHPEYLDIFDELVESHTAGLPQDDSVVWLTVSTLQIIAMFKERMKRKDALKHPMTLRRANESFLMTNYRNGTISSGLLKR